MGIYKFKWDQPAEEVYVTGTFDAWAKSEKLEKVGDVFEKTVTIPDTSDKIYYKYFVDGAWKTDDSAPQEQDESGNQNNLLSPDQIMSENNAAAAVLINSVGPDSTTAQLAGAVPLEKKENDVKAAATAAEHANDATPGADLPGGFPVTPAVELDQKVGVNPLPAANGAINPVKLEPGAEVPQAGAEEVNKHVKTDEESYENSDALPGGQPFLAVNPLPATDGAVNPPKTEGGEGGIPEATPEDINKNVKLDQESYEKSDALPGHTDLENKPVSVNPLPAADFGVNPIQLQPGEKVPEASAEDINRNVKLDKESYEKSDALPGLDALPPVSNNMIPESSLPIVSAQDAALLNTVGPDSTTTKLAGEVPLEPKVPAIVKDSQEKANVDPEASAVPEEVREKAQVEAEILDKVAVTPSAAESTVDAVPAPVKDSVVQAGKDAGATGNEAAVEDKKAVEGELKKTVDPTPPAAESSTKADVTAPAANGEGASKATAAEAEAAAKKKKKNRVSAFLSKINKKLKDL